MMSRLPHRGAESDSFTSSDKAATRRCDNGSCHEVTTNYDTTTFAGHHSEAMLLGIFNVSILHNLVHLLFGGAGFLGARTASDARAYLIGGGAVYLVLWPYGLVIDKTSAANFVPLNGADDWLHLVLGLGMIGLGVGLARRVR